MQRPRKAGQTSIPPKRRASPSQVSSTSSTKDKLPDEEASNGSRSPVHKGNTQVLLGSQTNVKVGGRMTTISYPPDVAEAVSNAGAQERRNLQSAPSEDLALEYAYGFNGSCKHNLYSIGQSGCLYNVGCIGVVFDFVQNNQTFFTGHTAEVTAVGYCEERRLVATGQRAGLEPPHISLWDVDDPSHPELHHLLGHARSIHSAQFSADGKYLFSVGADLDSSKKDRISSRGASEGQSTPVNVWHLPDKFPSDGKASAQSQPQIRLERINGTYIHITTHKMDACRALALSSRCVTLLTSKGNWASVDDVVVSQIKEQEKGTFNDLACATFVPSSDGKEYVVVGGTGTVFVVGLDTLSVVRSISIMPGMSVRFVELMDNGEVACGGEDGGISFLKTDLMGFARGRQLLCDESGKPLNITTCRHFVVDDGSIFLLFGTLRGRIANVRLEQNRRIGKVHVSQQAPGGHAGVSAVCSDPKNANHLAVADSSGEIRFFDAGKCKLLEHPPYQCNAAVTCLTWGPGGKLLVAGQADGHVEGLVMAGWERGLKKDCGLYFRVVEKNVEGQAISSIRFSPNRGKYLAVGSSIKGNIHLFHVVRQDEGLEVPSYYVERVRVLTGNASAILTLQFSLDESQVASNARDGQILCWDCESGKRITPSMPKDSWFADHNKFKLTMSWVTIGIWNVAGYNNTMALVAEGHISDAKNSLLAVGDENGLVKLHRYPVPIDSAESKNYHAHASRVIGLTWTLGDRVISVAGAVGAGMMQWRLSTAKILNRSSSPDSPLSSPSTNNVSRQPSAQPLVQKAQPMAMRPLIPPRASVTTKETQTEERDASVANRQTQTDALKLPSESPSTNVTATPAESTTSTSLVVRRQQQAWTLQSAVQTERYQPASAKYVSTRTVLTQATTPVVYRRRSPSSSPAPPRSPPQIDLDSHRSPRRTSPVAMRFSSLPQQTVVRSYAYRPAESELTWGQSPSQYRRPLSQERQSMDATGYTLKMRSAIGELLAEALVFLYHPPFQLDTAVSYVFESGNAIEAFAPPQGWGVLRSNCGLLLWIQFISDGRLAAAAAADPHVPGAFTLWNKDLNLEFCCVHAGSLGHLDIKAKASGWAPSRTPLAGDEGLLHVSCVDRVRPLYAQVRIQMEPNFGAMAKIWLSEVRLRTQRLGMKEQGGMQRQPSGDF